MSLNWTQCRVTCWCATDCTCNLLHWPPRADAQLEANKKNTHSTRLFVFMRLHIYICPSPRGPCMRNYYIQSFLLSAHTQISFLLLWESDEQSHNKRFLLHGRWMWFGNYDECHPRRTGQSRCIHKETATRADSMMHKPPYENAAWKKKISESWFQINICISISSTPVYSFRKLKFVQCSIIINIRFLLSFNKQW